VKKNLFLQALKLLVRPVKNLKQQASGDWRHLDNGAMVQCELL